MTEFLVRLLRRIADWLDKPYDNSDPVEEAVHKAYLYVGLSEDSYSQDFDLVRAGKLTDVYHHAAHFLKTDPELNTVGDVVKWLKS